MSNPKVFEFAKEIGMTPLALMDKIREWQLPVKSHMAELDPELINTIRTRMSGAGKTEEPAEKKPVARKKPAAPAAEKPASAAAPVTVKKAAGAVKSTAVKATKAAANPEPATAPKIAATTVVRRKKTEAVEEKSATDLDHDEASATPEVEAVAPAVAAVTEAPAAAPVKAATTAPKTATAEAKPAAQPEKAPVKPAVGAKATPATETKAAPAVEAKEASAAIEAATTTATTEEKKNAGPARKKEVAIGASGVASAQNAPAAPRRNIVGRMDLSRVQPPAGTRVAPSGPRPGGFNSGGGAGGGGFNSGGPGLANRPKGNLRAGFFQAPAPDLPTATDDRGHGNDKRRLRTPGVPAEGAAREHEEAPPVFDAAEFRKREMVFQPKKKKGMLSRPAMKTEITKAAAHKRMVDVYGAMKVSDLAHAMGMKTPELIKGLMKNGVMATINTELDFDTIALIVTEFGFEAQNIQKSATEVITETAFGDLTAAPIERPPVVAVMGHVDHGKTSLLDAIRSAKVAAGEAGGITQHIGAYQVSLDDGYKITFLDTPGHEAFTQMRARGANVTDIAIIVVAADDGVMPQTAEAINHAKAANVPMIVAVNKIDKPGANIDRIKQQLTEYEVVPEEWGGTTMFAPVSALKHTGIKELLEQIKIQAEVMELKANPKRSATGIVIESRLEKGRGSVATVLVQDGTLEVGQHIVAGAVVGRVRSLVNDRGERIPKATPGMPVELLGLDAVPQAGDKFDVVKDEKAAEEVAAIRHEAAEAAKNQAKKMSLEEIFSKVQKGDVKELAVVLKTDVAGSMEALQGMFQKLSTDEVKVRIIHSAIGGITENDVNLASTAKGIIIGFNVRPDSGAQAAAKRQGIEIRTYSIVYELIDDMKKAMGGMLTPDVVEKIMGKAEVRNTFTVPKIGMIAGCMVSEGKIARSNMARLIRDGKIVYEGKIASLKRFKDDAREVASGFECGIGIENFNDIKVGDTIEAFVKEEIARELGAPSAEA